MTTHVRARELEELAKSLAADGIRYVQIETPDINGTLRGKLTTIKKALSPSGGAFCTILYGLSVCDDVYESEHSSFANGFPDSFAIADPATAVVFDRDHGVASVICDMYGKTREDYFGLSPRSALRSAVASAESLGFEARFAVEIELFVVRADDAAIAAGEHHAQQALGRVHNAYSLARMDELRPLAAEFLDRMAEMGVEIDAIHTELGYGMVELALTHLPALEAADACARTKLYLKEFLAKRGFAAVYMPKWRFEESGCGGHVHQSLWRDGEPVFAGPDGAVSDICKHYVAGQLATLQDFSAVFYPTINSYRRMDALSWAPENVTWGLDNRTCALRVINQPGPSATRIEHRCPGADINPYLAIAAMLSGGLYGIEEGLTPPDAVTGNAGELDDVEALPRSLDDAVARLQASTVAGQLLGEDLVGQYIISRNEECRQWIDWQTRTISDWELSRYFDAH